MTLRERLRIWLHDRAHPWRCLEHDGPAAGARRRGPFTSIEVHPLVIPQRDPPDERHPSL